MAAIADLCSYSMNGEPHRLEGDVKELQLLGVVAVNAPLLQDVQRKVERVVVHS